MMDFNFNNNNNNQNNELARLKKNAQLYLEVLESQLNGEAVAKVVSLSLTDKGTPSNAMAEHGSIFSLANRKGELMCPAPLAIHVMQHPKFQELVDAGKIDMKKINQCLDAKHIVKSIEEKAARKKEMKEDIPKHPKGHAEKCNRCNRKTLNADNYCGSHRQFAPAIGASPVRRVQKKKAAAPSPAPRGKKISELTFDEAREFLKKYKAEGDKTKVKLLKKHMNKLAAEAEADSSSEEEDEMELDE